MSQTYVYKLFVYMFRVRILFITFLIFFLTVVITLWHNDTLSSHQNFAWFALLLLLSSMYML